MAKLQGKSVEFSPEVHALFDVVGLGKGVFAFSGSSTGWASTSVAQTWWFEADGTMVSDYATIAEAGTWSESPDLAAGEGMSVVAAHLVKRDWTVLTQSQSPGSDPGESIAFAADIVNLTQSPDIENWGADFALAQPRRGGFSDHGINLQRIDSSGRAQFETVLKTENWVYPNNGDAPISGVEMAEVGRGGLAVVGRMDSAESSGGVWLWSLNAKGEVRASLRVDKPGSALNIFDAQDPTVAGLARGDILVGWDDHIRAGSNPIEAGELKARRIDVDGNLLGNEFTITENGNARNLDILAMKDGGFMATWIEPGADTSIPYSVKVREFDATGNAVGPERTIAERADLTANPTLVAHGPDGAMLFWHNRFDFGDGTTQSFAPHVEARKVSSDWDPGKTEKGTKRSDDLQGTGQDDLLLGKGGRDILRGLDGDDDMRGDAGKDKLFGGFGRDVLEGGSGNDRLFGGGRDDVLAGGAGNDRMKGGAGRDQFVFREKSGTDRVLDFDAEMDVIHLQNELFGAEFAPLLPRVREVKGNTVIDYPGDDIDAKIILRGVTGLEYDDTFTVGPIQVLY